MITANFRYKQNLLKLPPHTCELFTKNAPAHGYFRPKTSTPPEILLKRCCRPRPFLSEKIGPISSTKIDLRFLGVSYLEHVAFTVQ